MPAPDKGESWGILGGAFDPVHLGHIKLALDIKSELKLDGIMLIPSFLHPFKNKDESASFDDRIEMLKLAASKYNCFHISKIEKTESLSGYTLDTIKAAKRIYPESEFVFIIGADNIKGIENWHKPDEIFENIKVVAGSRPGEIVSGGDLKYADKIEHLKTTELDIASSKVRELLKSESSSSELIKYIEPSVLNYIKENSLYL